MIIGVDAGCLGIRDERLAVGVYRLAKDLLQELGQLDKKNNYLLYSFYPIQKELMKTFGKRTRNVLVKPSKGWLKLWLPLQLIKDKPDVFLALGQSLPSRLLISPKIKNIGFVYDLAFEKFPEMYPDSLVNLRKNSINLSRNSDTIISISNSTKEDLIDLYKVPSQKIFVAYPGVSRELKLEGKKYFSPKQYFLFVGALKRTKNLPTVIKGFSHFIKQTNNDFLLYVVGGDKWLDADILKSLEPIAPLIKKRIIFLGFLKEDKLYQLYRGAYALVSPSFYEGFGLPYLEAMRLGCPVIGSRSGSGPEVIGDAGILVDPQDYKTVSNAMLRLVKNKKLRSMYTKRGLERDKKFSIEQFAKKVLQIINLYEKKN